MLTDRFYQDLPELTGFEEIFAAENYMDAPRDWMVIVTDVVHSTDAISEGRYKQVNIAGAVAVAVVSNVIGNLRFPFTFGGDGMTAVLPPDTARRALAGLADLQETIRRSFALELRVGALTVGETASKGFPIRIAKLRVSEKYTQAVFDGPGIAHAEELIKNGAPTEHRGLPENSRVKANTQGFSCRWREIPSSLGEIVALIVEARQEQPDCRAAAVRTVLEAIRESLGSEERYHPVSSGVQQAVHRLHEIDNEARVHARGRGGFLLALHRLWVLIQLAAVSFAVRWDLPLRYHYKTLNQIPLDNISHADFRKYDGRLKMVFACTTEDRTTLQARLDELESDGVIAYGMHVTDHALITCVMHLRAPDEVHFIDGGNGGYTLASAELKQKLVAAS